MKYISIILLFLTIKTTAQDKIHTLSVNQSYAGKELIKASNLYMGSIAVYTGGAVIAGLGIKNGITPMFILGGACILTGSIMQISAWKHVANAGEYLDPKDDDEFTLGINGNGLTIAYAF